MSKTSKTKRLLSVVLSTLLLISIFTIVPANAADTNKKTSSLQSGDFYYYVDEDDKTATITGYVGTDEKLVIPSTINGYTVTEIDNGAFGYYYDEDEDKEYDFDFIKSISIPDSVTVIGNNAFDGTGYYYDDDNWENGVLYIGKFLIKADNISGTYSIKQGTTVIADEAFYNDGYYDEDSDEYVYTDSELEGINIPDSVTHIGYSAFQKCSKLKDVTIPGSVKTIGEYAFAYCTNLTSVTIPNSVTEIPYGAFLSCTDLSNISISSNVTFIGEDAFYDTAYYYNSSNWQNDVLYIDNYLIKANNIFGTYNIKAGTTLIADSAFYDCQNLIGVVIPDSVIYINGWAFSYCKSLSSVTIGNKVKEIGYSAFRTCALTSVTIPKNVSAIENLAFGYYYNEDLDAYMQVANFTINGYEETAAETYAKNNGFTFVKITPPVPTPSNTKTTAKKANTLKVKAVNKTYKANKLKKKALSYKAVKVTKAQGKVTYKLTKKNKNLKFKNGKVTVKKKTKKGTYKIKVKVTAAGNASYKKGEKTVTVKVKIK